MNKALVVFSGGQDSTTCLAWSLSRFDEVFALSFDYGQRHKVELDQAKKICDNLKISHEIIDIGVFSNLRKNALTHDMDITAGNESEMPSTFVPGRNLLFLNIACMKAYDLGITDVVIGVCHTDYSGYPDCRDAFIKSFQETACLAMEKNFKIHTPLMELTKGESIRLMKDLGQLDVLADSHTCYEGRRPACGKCPACELRLHGFKEAGIIDPLEYKD